MQRYGVTIDGTTKVVTASSLSVAAKRGLDDRKIVKNATVVVYITRLADEKFEYIVCGDVLGADNAWIRTELSGLGSYSTKKECQAAIDLIAKPIVGSAKRDTSSVKNMRVIRRAKP